MGKAAAPSLCFGFSLFLLGPHTLSFSGSISFFIYGAHRASGSFPPWPYTRACGAMNRKRRKRARKVSMPAALPGKGPGAQGAATPSPLGLAAACRSSPRQAAPQHSANPLPSPQWAPLAASLSPHPATHAPLVVTRVPTQCSSARETATVY